MQFPPHLSHTHTIFFKIPKSKGIFFTLLFVFSEQLHHILKIAFIIENYNGTQHKRPYMCKHMVFSNPQQKKQHRQKTQNLATFM
jgi:hypothetical protein